MNPPPGAAWRPARTPPGCATHSPADLNDLNQLTNTKIAMRSEPKVLERMAEYAGAYALAVAKSFIYRIHAVTFKTLPPQTRHRGV